MKDKHIAGFLALFLGGLGIHKFYIGRTGQGFLYLLFCWTYIPLIFSIMDAIYYFRFSSNEEFNRKICPIPEHAPSRGNKLEELKKLKELLDMKAITKAEFETEKGKIIAKSGGSEKEFKSLPKKTSQSIQYQKSDKSVPTKKLVGIMIGIIFLFWLVFSVISNISNPRGYKVITDKDHPTRKVCEQELIKRIANLKEVQIGFEDIREYENHISLEGFLETKSFSVVNKTREQTTKIADEERHCLKETSQKCQIKIGSIYTCYFQKSDLSKTVLEFDFEKENYFQKK